MEALLLLSVLLVSVVVTAEDDLQRLIESTLEDTLPHFLKGLSPSEKPPKEWLSNREAMEFMDLSKSTLQRWRDDGTLPYSKIGGCVFYARTDLLRVLEEHRVSSNGHAS